MCDGLPLSRLVVGQRLFCGLHSAGECVIVLHGQVEVVVSSPKNTPFSTVLVLDSTRMQPQTLRLAKLPLRGPVNDRLGPLTVWVPGSDGQ